MDNITNSTLIPPINKINTTPIPYLNTFIILLPPIPSIRFFVTITAISVAVSALAAEIESIYYPPPD